jgi:hypothetical protein
MFYEGISYQCPALKMYGYRNDLELQRAIKRELNKRDKKAQAKVQP